MRYRDLFESRSAPLFHGTGLIRAAKIIDSNILGLTYDGENTKTSFSRSYEESENLASKVNNYVCVLVVDQDKLSRRYKIEPFHDQVWANDMVVDGMHVDEQEEVVYGKIKNVANYLISINLHLPDIEQYIKNPEEETMDYFSSERDGIEALRKLAKHPLLNKWVPRKTLIARKRFENIPINSVIFTQLGWIWIENIEHDTVTYRQYVDHRYQKQKDWNSFPRKIKIHELIIKTPNERAPLPPN